MGSLDMRRVAAGAVAALLVLLVAGVAFGASQIGLFGGSQRAPVTVGPQGPMPGQGYGQVPRQGPNGPGQPRQPGTFGVPFRTGTVTIRSIDGSNLTVATADGWTRTITVTSSTTITRAGKTIALSDLKVGDQIRFREVQNADGTTSVTAIVVVLPQVAGRVTAVTSDTITIQRQDGTTMAVHVDANTTYQVRGVTSATLANITVGMIVRAQGTQNTDGSLQALVVTAASKP